VRRSRSPRVPLVTAPRTVVGYHGCSRETAETILAEGRFLVSTNTYDWLGEGVYFWEFAPYRALEWAREQSTRQVDEPVVLAATLHLGRCLNLLDREHFAKLEAAYERFVRTVGSERISRNTAAGAHFLDRYIIDSYCRLALDETTAPFQTVRGCFPEGEPIYPGSKLLKKTHTQIAIRDITCISRVRLVQFP
jgi:hypothetical protein